MNIQKYIDAIRQYAPAREDVLEIASALHAKNALGIHHTNGSIIVLDGYSVRALCPELLTLAQTRAVPEGASFDEVAEIAAANMRAQGISTTIGGGEAAPGFDAAAIAEWCKTHPMGGDQ